MASEATQLNRVRRYCAKIIARAKAAVDVYGRTGAWEWTVRADIAERVLKELERK